MYATIPVKPPSNEDIMKSCINTYNKSYDKVTECLNENLSNLTDIVHSGKFIKEQITSSGKLYACLYSPHKVKVLSMKHHLLGAGS